MRLSCSGNRRSVVVPWAAIGVLLAAPCFAAAADVRPFTAGAALSQRALVQRPAPLKGLAGWTIETRRPRGVYYAVAISPDSRRLATGGWDGMIRIWDLETGEFQRVLVGHDSYVMSLAWSSDGGTLASAGGWDYTARVWDVGSGRQLRSFKHESYVTKVGWSPDGRVLMVVGGESGTAMFWDVTSVSEVAKRAIGQAVNAAVWSPDGQSIAWASRQNVAQVMDTSIYQMSGSLGETADEVGGLAWSPEGKHLAVANAKGVRIFEMPAARLVRTLAAAAHVVAWSPDGQTIATSPAGGYVQLWNAADGAIGKRLPIAAASLAWSPDGKRLAAQTFTGVQVFDLTSQTVRFTLANGYSPSAAWSRAGRRVVFGLGSRDVSLWDPNGTKPALRFEGHSAAIHAAAINASGKLLATASDDKTVRLWETAGGKELHVLDAHQGPVHAVAWSTNGRTLASGSADKTVKLWDSGSGQAIKTLEGHRETVTTLAWSAKSLASGSRDQNVVVWNPQNGESLRTLSLYSPALTVAWSQDGAFLAGGGTEPSLFVWNPANGAVLKRLERAGSPPSVAALAWSPNPAVLASGRGNHTLQLWDLRTEKPLHDLKTMAPVLAVDWSADGKTVVASTQDRCVRSWDAASGAVRATVVAGETDVVAVSGEGHFRAPPGGDPDLVFVVQTSQGQETLSPAEFAAKYRWKNQPALVKLTGE